MSKVIIEPVFQVGPEITASVNALKAQFKQAEDAAKGIGGAGADSAKQLGDEVKKEVGLIATLRAEMQRLQKQREQSFDPKEVRALNKELAATEKQLSELESLGRRPSPIASFFGGAADFVKANFLIQSIDQVAGLLGRGFEASIRTEQFEQALTTMLGSAQAAQDRIASLVDFAAKTPFEMPQIEDATKRLLAFGVSNDNLIPTLQRLGDVAAITGTDFAALSTMFGQIRATQVAYTGDLNQFANAGIPIYAQLAKQLGTTEAGVKSLAGTGQISFQIIDEAFKQMTSSGGQFFGGMEKQSQTLGGRLSTLSDNFSILLMNAVQPLIPAINALVTGLTSAIETIIRVGSTIAAIPSVINENRLAFGLLLTGIATLNAGLIQSNALWLIQQARLKGAAIVYGVQAAVTKGVTVAQQGLNAALRANPIGLVVGLVTTLAGVFALLYDKFWQVRVGTEAVWAGIREVGSIMLDIATGPVRGLMRALNGLINLDFKEVGAGIADALGGNFAKALKRIPGVGKAAGAAWNKAYRDELIKGAPKAIVNEVEKGTEAINQQVAADLKGTQQRSAAKAKYIKQLEYERQVINATTDSINQQTEALRKQAAEAGRAREIETANVDPLAREILKIDDERSKSLQAADDARAKALDDLAKQEAKAIENLKSQRIKAEEEVARMRVEGGDPREIQQRLAFIASFGEQVKNVEQQIAAERLNIEAAYQRNLQAAEVNTYTARRIAANRFLQEQTEILKQNSEAATEISRELIAAVYSTSTDPQARRVGIDTAMQGAMQQETLRIETATNELKRVRAELEDDSVQRTQAEIDALVERELVQLQIIESSFLRREKINRDYNARLIEEDRRAADERIEIIAQSEREFLRVVDGAMAAVGRTEGLSELASSYQAALAQIVNLRRKFEDSAAAEAININRASLDRQIADMESAGIEMLQVKRAVNAELTAEEAQALNRYEVLQSERAKLNEDYLKAQEQFSKDQLQSVIDFASSTLQAILNTVGAAIDLQIQQIDRVIAAQERAVSDAERIAEQGNARQLALERDRLDKLQAERARFVRQQQALAVIELIANSTVAIAKAAAQGGVAAPITIAATLAALAVGLAQARAQAQSAAAGFKTGGYTGDAPTSSVAGVVHGREFVVNAAATAKHRPLLEAINAGKAIATPPPVFGELAPLQFAAPVERWAAASPPGDTTRIDALERELAGLRADVQDVAEAVRAIPQTRFTLDERGLTRRVVETATKNAKRARRK